MTQKLYVKMEKYLACDLKAGDLFIEGGDVDSFNLGLTNDLAVVVMVRTNVPDTGVEDGDMVVFKLHIAVADRESPGPRKVDPHAPPGLREQ